MVYTWGVSEEGDRAHESLINHLEHAMALKAAAYKFLLGFDYRTDPQVIGPFPLAKWQRAPDRHGVYEIGLGSTKSTFVPRYLGKAADQTLRARIKQHFMKSSNDSVEKNKPECHFTCRPIEQGPSQRAIISNIEGIYLIAFSEQYCWNNRQEWSQHWSIEDLSDS